METKGNHAGVMTQNAVAAVSGAISLYDVHADCLLFSHRHFHYIAFFVSISLMDLIDRNIGLLLFACC